MVETGEDDVLHGFAEHGAQFVPGQPAVREQGRRRGARRRADEKVIVVSRGLEHERHADRDLAAPARIRREIPPANAAVFDLVGEQRAQDATGLLVACLLPGSKQEGRVDRFGDTEVRDHLVSQPRRPVQLVGRNPPNRWRRRAVGHVTVASRHRVARLLVAQLVPVGRLDARGERCERTAGLLKPSRQVLVVRRGLSFGARAVGPHRRDQLALFASERDAVVRLGDCS
jgi:hypothetical protein